MLLLAAIACSKKAPPPRERPNPEPVIAQMRDFATRCDACKEDRDCLHALRDEYDHVKKTLLVDGGSLEGADKQSFDAELLHLRQCGDGGGLTFWVDP